MAKRRSGAGWNSDKAVGQMEPFTLDEIDWLCRYLAARGNWHDLCLLSAAADSWLRASDLLGLKVEDITYRDGSVRWRWKRKQDKNKRGVFPRLTPETRECVAYWLKVSGKQPKEYVFTRHKKEPFAPPITRVWYAKQVKLWAELLGHAREDYSTHSLRRSKPIHMYENGEKVAVLTKMLGHKSEASTLEYLGINQKRADEATQRHRMVPGGLIPKSSQNVRTGKPRKS